MVKLIMEENMGKSEKKYAREHLHEHRDRMGQKGVRQVSIKLFKPTREVKLGTVFKQICKLGRPATLREAMILCRSNSAGDSKKKITVISRRSDKQRLISLAYWFDGAWRLTSFRLSRIWRQSYFHEFAYILR
jgi:hypothetical protein